MHGYIKRYLEKRILKDLTFFPAVGIVGPRQCGKSTMIKHLTAQKEDFIYLDLENPLDRNKLQDPLLFFEANRTRTICLDEVQRLPEIFSVLRSVIDQSQRAGQFIVLGSASPQLLRQTSESLAGRIVYHFLTPFTVLELHRESDFSLHRLWIRGGYPRSYLAPDDDFSFRWRESFLQTFLERDLHAFGFNLPPETLRRFLILCAHHTGQLINFSQMANALDLSHNTIRKYTDLMVNTYLLRILRPYSTNIKKRLVKNPKIYLRDSGLLLALLGIRDFNSLLSHPILGASWEAFALENILSVLPDWEAYFYRTSNGAEIDLLLIKGERRIAVEFKSSTTPKVSKGFVNSVQDLGIEERFIIAPLEGQYPVKNGITVSGLLEFLLYIGEA
jgi:predicted AAA+ superfamily ATPase